MIQKNLNKDLEFLKKHEDKIKSYQEKEFVNKSNQSTKIPYRFLSYQVKNPFKGI
jgi:hypothetical protein